MGKLSADIDIEVATTGKPSLRLTPKGAFDIGLPLHSAAGTPLGMVVIVIRETFTTSEAAAMERASVIRDQLQAKIPSMQALLHHAVLTPSKAAMIVQTPLPENAGDFSHFILDAEHDRLYLVGNRPALVFNRNGELLNHPGTPPASTDRSETRKRLQALARVSGEGDIWFDEKRKQIYFTGPKGLAVYVAHHGKFQLDSSYPIMHSTTSFFDPERSYLYAAHPKNSEDGAALQIFKIE